MLDLPSDTDGDSHSPSPVVLMAPKPRSEAVDIHPVTANRKRKIHPVSTSDSKIPGSDGTPSESIVSAGNNRSFNVRSSPKGDGLSSVHPPIVYVHGFKGSSLVHKSTGEINYGSPECFLNMHSPDFSNPMRWDADGRIGRDDLVPGEILQDLKIFGYQYARIQGPVLEYLAKRAKRQGTVFHGYVALTHVSMFYLEAKGCEGHCISPLRDPE